MAPGKRQLPFSVNRNDARSLIDQVADGIREAIVGGYYKAGEAIPSSRELEASLGVSRIVPKIALARLAEEGYLVSRHGMRMFVRDKGEKQWKGHVVFLGFTEDGNYFQDVFAGVLRARLMEAGYLFTEVPLSWDARNIPDFSALDAALARSVDLIIVRNSEKNVIRHVSKCGVPYIAVTNYNLPLAGTVGIVRDDDCTAVHDFAADCARLGIEEVVAFVWKDKGVREVTPQMRAEGLKVTEVRLPRDRSPKRLEILKKLGFDTVTKMLSTAKPSNHPAVQPFNCPTVQPSRRGRAYFFADDYLACGALLAFAMKGLVAPRDFSIATWANAGLTPPYPHELSRMEMDPVGDGGKVAAAALEYLESDRFPEGLVVGPRWVVGETMGAVGTVPIVREEGTGKRERRLAIND